TLRGELAQRGNYEMKNVSAAAEWRDQRLTITHCEWNDALGSFAGSANWSRQDNRADFQIRSSIDPKAFLRAFGLPGPFADVAFYSPPLVEISGSANIGEDRLRPAIIGHVTLGKFAYRTMQFSDFMADFSWDAERTLLRDVLLRLQTAQLRPNLSDPPTIFRLNIAMTI